MATIDDKATEFEERDRALALQLRRPVGPAACGACFNCGAPLAADARWCDIDCHEDWARRVANGG